MLIKENGEVKYMKTYSDYENLTYDYLKNYNFFKAKLKSYTAELKDMEEQIRAITDAKIAKYDKESGGYSEFEGLESQYAKKERLSLKKMELEDNKNKIYKLITKIDMALNELEGIDIAILTQKYINGHQWQQVAEIVKYSARNCQRRARTAINKLAINIFGSEACQQGCLFICLNTKYKN